LFAEAEVKHNCNVAHSI